MIIREFRPADLSGVAALLEQLGYEPGEREIQARLAHLAKASDHWVRVADVDGRVVGLLHVYERPALEKAREAVVQSLVVDAAQRSRGVGATLMREAERWARERGLPAVALYTRIDRDAARAFYERLGYGLVATSHLMRREL
ncbi:MAG: GNAT family N-acetyltransferase [Reyranella sp.]|nr:GNAT family N-acetyltransferase [Reyranella sp.]